MRHPPKGGAARLGYKGNKTYLNDGRQGTQILPRTDDQGNSIKYKEYDINPFQKGVGRGEERVVIGSNGKAYLTSNHYLTFTELRK